MAVITLRQEAEAFGDFYVPRFEIKIGGKDLPGAVVADVLQLTYTDHIKELDGFEFTVNNWDESAFEFKYVGAETAKSMDPNNTDQRQPFNPLHRLFEPGRTVQVSMGYVGTLKTMLTGTFTTLEPTFPSTGGSTLAVRGLNLLHQLRNKQRSQAFSGKKDSEIAQSFKTLPDPVNKGKKLPVLIGDNALQVETDIPYVAQKNQYDIDFLYERARRAGYVLHIKEKDKKPVGVYFGRSEDGNPAIRTDLLELRWGISLMDFKPTMSTAGQVSVVTVNGWNVATKSPIVGKASIENQKLNQDLHKLLEKSDAREEQVVDEPMFTQKQADLRAQAILLERTKDLVTATGTCVGLPDLRAGCRIGISGLGARFDGEYFVTDTVHTINDSGYITKFTARREALGKGADQ